MDQYSDLIALWEEACTRARPKTDLRSAVSLRSDYDRPDLRYQWCFCPPNPGHTTFHMVEFPIYPCHTSSYMVEFLIHHWNYNSKSYLKAGQSMGAEMVKLMKL
jgi:hypothetical protein